MNRHIVVKLAQRQERVRALFDAVHERTHRRSGLGRHEPPSTQPQLVAVDQRVVLGLSAPADTRTVQLPCELDASLAVRKAIASRAQAVGEVASRNGSRRTGFRLRATPGGNASVAEKGRSDKRQVLL